MTLSSSVISGDATREIFELNVEKAFVAISELKKTLHSGHFDGLAPESRSKRIASNLLEGQAFMYAQLSENAKNCAESYLDEAASLSTGDATKVLQVRKGGEGGRYICHQII
jgi:hypothetical protein